MWLYLRRRLGLIPSNQSLMNDIAHLHRRMGDLELALGIENAFIEDIPQELSVPVKSTDAQTQIYP